VSESECVSRREGAFARARAREEGREGGRAGERKRDSVCVCVCERERERARVNDRESRVSQCVSGNTCAHVCVGVMYYI